MKTYIVNFQATKNAEVFEDTSIHKNKKECLSYLNDIHKIYSKMDYILDRIIRKTNDNMFVEYYISYVWKEGMANV